MGLERGWWLPRKQKNTVHMQQLSTCHSNFQFSQQSLTAFESRFNFPDQCTTHKHMQRPETCYRTNWQRRFWRLSCCHVTASAQRLSVFSATIDRILAFDFLDRHTTFNHGQRLKTFIRANQSRPFLIAIE